MFKRTGIVTLFVLACYINHRIQLKKEDALFVPIGQQVEVNGHMMSVYIEGSGEKILVFMSGAYLSFAASSGITRMIPSLTDSDAIQ